MHIEHVVSRKVGKREYFTYRIVMDHGRVRGRRRRTVLNLGVQFPVPDRQWKLLCFMVDARLKPDDGQLHLDLDLPELVPIADDIARRFRVKWKTAGLGPHGDEMDPTVPAVTDALA